VRGTGALAGSVPGLSRDRRDRRRAPAWRERISDDRGAVPLHDLERS
jgi:hypothetical protein